MNMFKVVRSGMIIFLVVIVLIGGGVVYLLSRACNEYKQERDLFQELVGRKIVMEKDTFLIVDYSMVNETLLLGNGQTISIYLVKNNKLKVIK